MKISSTLLSSILLAVSLAPAPSIGAPTHPARAAPPPSLSFVARIKDLKGEHKTLADADRARAAAIRQRAAANAERAHVARAEADVSVKVGTGNNNVPIESTSVSYVAKVGVGSPPTEYTLIIDTGSSNTWVGADKAYVKTATSEQTPYTVQVTYGSGSFKGDEYVDRVTLSNSLVIDKQSIGVASSSTGFNGVDGILGVGPQDLTIGTLSDTRQSIPTVVDNLYTQGTISQDLLGVAFEPSSGGETTPGTLTFGGVDNSQTQGDVTFVPITSTSPASQFWGIDESISYGGATVLGETAGIVDTGTTLVLIATDAFQAYQAQTGGVLDKNTGLLSITSEQYDNLKPLVFNVGGQPFALTPNAQIWPRALNSAIGGQSGAIYLIVSDLGTPSGKGLDFINGYTFLQRFYSVYDTGNMRVGLAPTPHTDSTVN